MNQEILTRQEARHILYNVWIKDNLVDNMFSKLPRKNKTMVIVRQVGLGDIYIHNFGDLFLLEY